MYHTPVTFLGIRLRNWALYSTRIFIRITNPVARRLVRLTTVEKSGCLLELDIHFDITPERGLPALFAVKRRLRDIRGVSRGHLRSLRARGLHKRSRAMPPSGAGSTIIRVTMVKGVSVFNYISLRGHSRSRNPGSEDYRRRYTPAFDIFRRGYRTICFGPTHIRLTQPP